MAPIPDAIIYRTPDRLMQRHGEEALRATSRCIQRMVDRRDCDRFFLWLRIRHAIIVLRAPPTGPLH